MYKQVTPLNHERHAGLRVQQGENYTFAKNLHLIALSMAEVVAASAYYPVVFIETKGNKFRLFAMLGLEPEQNVFIAENGSWDEGYVPALIRRYPFALGQTDYADQFSVCIDEASSLLSQSAGEPLFSENGSPTAFLEAAQLFLSQLQGAERQSECFYDFVTKHDLLKPLAATVVMPNGEKKTISGAHTIDQAKLEQVDIEAFGLARDQGFLGPAYAQIVSLGQVNRLAVRTK